MDMPKEIWAGIDHRWHYGGKVPSLEGIVRGEPRTENLRTATRYVRAPEGSVVLTREDLADIHGAFNELMTGVRTANVQQYDRLNRAAMALARLTAEEGTDP